MSFRPLALLVALLMLALLSGCGTDTRTVDSLDTSVGKSHYSGVYVGGNDNPNNRAQYLGYSLNGIVNIGGTGNETPAGSGIFSPPPAYIPVDYTITCLSCHPPSPTQPNGDTNANAIILKDYARSGHADVSAIPWTVPETGASCQRCHTTFGFLYHLDNYVPANYDPLTPFSGIRLSSPAISPQWTGDILSTQLNQQEEYQNAMQVLICSACHPESGLTTGTLRTAFTPGGFVAIWTQNNVTARFDFPDAGASNLCIRCHSARRAGPNITTTATTTAHYLPAAAMVYSGLDSVVNITVTAAGSQSGFKDGLGYEFTGEDYANPSFSHKAVGSPGGKGPCVGCHMSGAAGHTLKVVTENANGEITAINSSACTGCHGDLLPAWLNGKKTGFEAAADRLDMALQANGVYWYSGPRATTDITPTSPATTVSGFYATPYDVSALAGVNTTVTNALYATKAAAAGLTTIDLQGAAFNLWLCKHKGGDPAAYVHNSDYIKKLIFDSLDYLDNGVLNGTLTPNATVADDYLDGNISTDGVIERP